MNRMPMIKNKGSGIPGGWRYFQPETQTLLKAQNWWSLCLLVRRHRDANRLPVGSLEQDIETWVCEELIRTNNAGLLVFGHDPEPPPRPEIVSRASKNWRWSDVVRFTMTLGDSIVTGNNRVAKDEAERRAAICAECPSNLPIADCNSGCSSLKAAFSNFIARVAGGETSKDSKLQACEFCGCINKAQIWFPLDILQRHTSQAISESLPSHCWKKPAAAQETVEEVNTTMKKKKKGKVY